MLPNPNTHNPDPNYLRELVTRIGLSQRKTALSIGVAERTFRDYLAGKTPAPYPVQYCLEVLASSAEPKPQAP